nr:MAG TPA: hypothetical protein [Caudoviricetes sp.]
MHFHNELHQYYDWLCQLCYLKSCLSLNSIYFYIGRTISSPLIKKGFGTRVGIIGICPHPLVSEPSKLLLSEFALLGC